MFLTTFKSITPTDYHKQKKNKLIETATYNLFKTLKNNPTKKQYLIDNIMNS